ncbi:MAG TPA: hypothetical protein VMD59_10390 [Acidimicrobiales bacterium]|nr:hypothetical protein [Acidimicrobiales bacterium]
MLKNTLFATGVAASCLLAWRLARRSSSSAAPASSILIDPSKAKAILDLGREAVGASVEQALSARLGRAA